jgi:Zn-dependent protease
MRYTDISSGLEYKILAYAVIINVGFFIFNSIPWPPLDGSRVLYAFAPRPLQEIMEAIEGMGFAGLVIFMLLFYQLIAPFHRNFNRETDQRTNKRSYIAGVIIK